MFEDLKNNEELYKLILGDLGKSSDNISQFNLFVQYTVSQPKVVWLLEFIPKLTLSWFSDFVNCKTIASKNFNDLSHDLTYKYSNLYNYFKDNVKLNSNYGFEHSKYSEKFKDINFNSNDENDLQYMYRTMSKMREDAIASEVLLSEIHDLLDVVLSNIFSVDAISNTVVTTGATVLSNLAIITTASKILSHYGYIKYILPPTVIVSAVVMPLYIYKKYDHLSTMAEDLLIMYNGQEHYLYNESLFFSKFIHEAENGFEGNILDLVNDGAVVEL